MSVKKDGWEKIDVSEEAYFNDSDDDMAIDDPDSFIGPFPADINQPSKARQTEIISALPTLKRPLVDYPDDEDEEETLVIKKPIKSPQTMKFSLKNLLILAIQI